MDMHATFGFHKTPFTREVATDDVLALPHLDEARDAVRTQLERRMCAAVIAPAGAGKSALLRSLRAQLPAARYRVHYVKVTDLGKRDLCREIATCVGVRPAGSYPMLVRRLQEDFAEAGTESGVEFSSISAHSLALLDILAIGENLVRTRSGIGELAPNAAAGEGNAGRKSGPAGGKE